MLIHYLRSWKQTCNGWKSGSCVTPSFWISCFILYFQNAHKRNLSFWIQPVLMCLYLHDKQDKFSLNIAKSKSPWAPSRDIMTCLEDSFSICAWSLVIFSPLSLLKPLHFDVRLPEVHLFYLIILGLSFLSFYKFYILWPELLFGHT